MTNEKFTLLLINNTNFSVPEKFANFINIIKDKPTQDRLEYNESVGNINKTLPTCVC